MSTKREGIFWVTRNRKGEVIAFRPTEESGYSTGPAELTLSARSHPRALCLAKGMFGADCPRCRD